MVGSWQRPGFCHDQADARKPTPTIHKKPWRPTNWEEWPGKVATAKLIAVLVPRRHHERLLARIRVSNERILRRNVGLTPCFFRMQLVRLLVTLVLILLAVVVNRQREGWLVVAVRHHVAGYPHRLLE